MNVDDYNDEGIKNLRNVIIVQAFCDLKSALRKRWYNDASTIKKWFRSEAFSIMTYGDIDPEEVIRQAEDEVDVKKHKTVI